MIPLTNHQGGPAPGAPLSSNGQEEEGEEQRAAERTEEETRREEWRAEQSAVLLPTTRAELSVGTWVS